METDRFNPFASRGEPEPFDPHTHTETSLTEFESTDGRKYIRKILTNVHAFMLDDQRYISDGKMMARSLEELAQRRQQFYRLLKKYLGDYLVDTNYVLSADAQGKPQINILQEKEDGTPLGDLLPSTVVRSYRELPVDPAIMGQLEEINNIFVDQIQDDPEIQEHFSKPMGGGKDKVGGERPLIGVGESPLRYAYQDILPRFIPMSGTEHGDWRNIIVNKSGKLRIIDW